MLRARTVAARVLTRVEPLRPFSRQDQKRALVCALARACLLAGSRLWGAVLCRNRIGRRCLSFLGADRMWLLPRDRIPM